MHAALRLLADEDRHPVELAGPFEPRGQVHRVAHGRVVEAPLRAHVADDGGTGVDADPHADFMPVLVPEILAALGQPLLASQGRPAGPKGVVGLVDRGVPEGDDGVALVLVQGAAEVQDDVRHFRKIGVEQADEGLGRKALGDRGEAGDIGKEGRDLPSLAAEPEERRVVEDAIDDLRAEVVAEGALDETALAPFDAVAEERGGDEGGDGGEGRGDELDPDARSRGQQGARRGRGRQGQAEGRQVPDLFQHRRPDAGDEGQEEGRDPRDACRGLADEAPVDDIVEGRGQDLHPRVDAAEGRRPDIVQPGRRRPDEDGLVGELPGLDLGLEALFDLGLGIDDRAYRIGLVGSPRPEIAEDHFPRAIQGDF